MRLKCQKYPVMKGKNNWNGDYADREWYILSLFYFLNTKVEVLDDILKCLLEDLLDSTHLESMQKWEIEKATKEAIEETKELPMYV